MASVNKAKNIIHLIFYFIIPFLLDTVEAAKIDTEPILLFRSGFEEGVTLQSPYLAGGQWWQRFSGDDAGFQWPRNLPGGGGRFQYLVGKTVSTLSDYATSRIDQVPGAKGTSTSTLYQEVKKDDPNYTAKTRNMYVLYPGDTQSRKNSLEELYVRYWLKFQPDLNQVMAPNSWRNMMEWRESGNDYRWALYVIRSNEGRPLYWKIEAQKGVFGNSPVDWRIENKSVPRAYWPMVST